MNASRQPHEKLKKHSRDPEIRDKKRWPALLSWPQPCNSWLQKIVEAPDRNRDLRKRSAHLGWVRSIPNIIFNLSEKKSGGGALWALVSIHFFQDLKIADPIRFSNAVWLHSRQFTIPSSCKLSIISFSDNTIRAFLPFSKFWSEILYTHFKIDLSHVKQRYYS